MLCPFHYEIIVAIVKQPFNLLRFCIVLFLHRESDGASAFCATRANGLVETVTNAIHEKCRIVNQVRLLAAQDTYSLSSFHLSASGFLFLIADPKVRYDSVQ